MFSLVLKEQFFCLIFVYSQWSYTITVAFIGVTRTNARKKRCYVGFLYVRQSVFVRAPQSPPVLFCLTLFSSFLISRRSAYDVIYGADWKKIVADIWSKRLIPRNTLIEWYNVEGKNKKKRKIASYEIRRIPQNQNCRSNCRLGIDKFRLIVFWKLQTLRLWHSFIALEE